jgi:hypothetical protein
MFWSFPLRKLIETILVDGHTQPLEVQFPGSECDARRCLAPPELGTVNNSTLKCPVENIWFIGGSPSGSANAS